MYSKGGIRSVEDDSVRLRLAFAKRKRDRLERGGAGRSDVGNSTTVGRLVGGAGTSDIRLDTASVARRGRLGMPKSTRAASRPGGRKVENVAGRLGRARVTKVEKKNDTSEDTLGSGDDSDVALDDEETIERMNLLESVFNNSFGGKTSVAPKSHNANDSVHGVVGREAHWSNENGSGSRCPENAQLPPLDVQDDKNQTADDIVKGLDSDTPDNDDDDPETWMLSTQMGEQVSTLETTGSLRDKRGHDH